MLLLFNAVLLFPKTLLRLRFVNYFKPLLDACFGPYKHQYLFWTGMRLLVRSSIFGLSAISKNIGLFSGAILVAIVLCLHGILQPFKGRIKNFQDSVVLLNLLALYVTALYPDNESNFYKLLIIRVLILTVLVYFTLLIFCHCVMSLYGDVIKKKANKIKQVLIKIPATKQECLELNSQIPDVTFDYKKFQESLITLD